MQLSQHFVMVSPHILVSYNCLTFYITLLQDFSGTCSCSLHSCVKEDTRCNCDAGLTTWTYDDGHLTNKDQLPVTRLNFGNFDR